MTNQPKRPEDVILSGKYIEPDNFATEQESVLFHSYLEIRMYMDSLQSEPHSDRHEQEESEVFSDFIGEVKRMRDLYANKRFGLAEGLRDQLSEQLDDIMRAKL